MNPWAIVATLAAGFGLGQSLNKRNTLTWAEVNQWVRTTGNPDSYGRGYAGERLTSSRNAYIEVTRRCAGECWSVTAELVLNAKLNKPALRQTWTVDEFDEALEGRFGDNHRFRIDV